MSYLLLTINQCEVKIKSFLELNRVPRTSLKKPTPNFAICTFLKLLQNDFFYFKPVSRYQMSTCSIVRWRSDFYKMYQMTCRPINICYNRVEWHISRKIQKNPFPIWLRYFQILSTETQTLTVFRNYNIAQFRKYPFTSHTEGFTT